MKSSWFSSQPMADVTAAGNGIVDVPLAQTGEGIAECELLKWFVQEVCIEKKLTLFICHTIGEAFDMNYVVLRRSI